MACDELLIPTDNGGTPLTDYADASSVANDVVVSQAQTIFDGDGNAIEAIQSDRLPGDSAPPAPSATPPAPAARRLA